MQNDPSPLTAAIAAIRSGSFPRARTILLKILQQDETNAQAWLWLSATASTLQEVQTCLEKFLAIHPNHPQVQRRLHALQQQATEQQPDLHILRSFSCPQCGGAMRFNPEILDLQCTHCGYLEELQPVRTPLRDEALDPVLTSMLAYRRALQERTLRCKHCGALTIFPTASISLICPYCDSASFVAAIEDAELLPPQGIIPMQIEAEKAEQQLRAWLSNGFFHSISLKHSSIIKIYPVYIPFWLISAAISFHDPDPRSMLGRRDFLYNYWPVSGSAHPATQHVAELAPFPWQDLLEFQPEYLARWPATTYQVSLSTAFQQASAEMRKDALRKLPIGSDDSPSFYCRSYAQVLFPIWICRYRHQNRIYEALVNGQSGKVAGEKPLSSAKIALASLVSIFLLSIVGVLLAKVLSAIRAETASLLTILAPFSGVAILLIPALFMLVLLVVLILKS